jgi:hypothetical protein
MRDRETVARIVGGALDQQLSDEWPDVTLCKALHGGRLVAIGAARESEFLDRATAAVVDALAVEELQRKVAGQPSLFEAA